MLLQPVRLLIVTMLLDLEWRDFAAIREAWGLTAAALPKPLGTLRKADHGETRPAADARRSCWRLPSSGADRPVEHLEASYRIVATATATAIVASLTTGRGELAVVDPCREQSVDEGAS